MTPNPFSRRHFLEALALGTATWVSLAQADAPQKLDVNDPAARALGYVDNAAQVDAKKYPSYVKGSNCDNCLQLQGTAGDNFRPCSLFPGKLVSVSGWCLWLDRRDVGVGQRAAAGRHRIPNLHAYRRKIGKKSVDAARQVAFDLGDEIAVVRRSRTALEIIR